MHTVERGGGARRVKRGEGCTIGGRAPPGVRISLLARPNGFSSAMGSATGASAGASCEMRAGGSPAPSACPSSESRQKLSTSSSPYASRFTPCLSGSPVRRPNCPSCEHLGFRLNVRLVVTRPVPWRRARSSSRRIRVGSRAENVTGIAQSSRRPGGKRRGDKPRTVPCGSKNEDGSF